MAATTTDVLIFSIETCQETSGFLLGQAFPPLPQAHPTLPLSDENTGSKNKDGEPTPGSLLASSVEAVACNTFRIAETSCRKWYVLRDGELSAFSSRGKGEYCIGRLTLRGSCVEDVPEKAVGGALFMFRIRARYVPSSGACPKYTHGDELILSGYEFKKHI